ncbi:hypothetical protein MTO96_050319, partial [Rhipicephalus appendiculatus]
LPPDVASELSDVISNPSDTAPYQHLKTKVLERFMPSERVRLQQLLAEGGPWRQEPPPNYFAECDSFLGNTTSLPTQRCFVSSSSNAFLSQSASSSRRPADDINLDR